MIYRKNLINYPDINERCLPWNSWKEWQSLYSSGAFTLSHMPLRTWIYPPNTSATEPYLGLQRHQQSNGQHASVLSVSEFADIHIVPGNQTGKEPHVILVGSAGLHIQDGPFYHHRQRKGAPALTRARVEAPL